MPYPTDPAGIAGLWVAWLLMLMIYSYPLYKENPAFRFAEHTYIGLMLAIMLIKTTITTTIKMVGPPLMEGKVHYVIPIVLGFMMFFLLVPKYRWISRYPIALLVGAGFGLGMRGVLIPYITKQVISTITPPAAGAALVDWWSYFYIAIGTICATLYFVLTWEHKGGFGYTTRLGRWIIMIGLGAYFGNTVLFRMAMLSGRAQFFLQVLKIAPM